MTAGYFKNLLNQILFRQRPYGGLNDFFNALDIAATSGTTRIFAPQVQTVNGMFWIGSRSAFYWLHVDF